MYGRKNGWKSSQGPGHEDLCMPSYGVGNYPAQRRGELEWTLMVVIGRGD